MLLILLNWIFIFLTCLGLGYFTVQLISRFLGTSTNTITLPLVLVSGLFSLTVLNSFVTFAFPLNATVRYTIFLFSCLLTFKYRQEISTLLKDTITAFKELHIGSKLILAGIFFIALVKSAGPSELIDEGGYFLPYIRWIEDYRLIPGIANLEDRIGFNSSFHMLSAFFSMRDWFNDGLYDLNGFLLVICALYFISGPDNLFKKKSHYLISDYIKSFCLFFLLRNMLTSSAADLANVFFAELILILFVEKVESMKIKETDGNLIMMFLVGIMLTTIKVSSIGLLLLPLSAMIVTGTKLKKNFLLFSALGLVLIAAWMVRSYFMSGYLIYPVYYIDLFDPVWKIPEDFARNQYYYVQQFARLNVERMDSELTSKLYPTSKWVPMWFNMQNGFNKITFVTLVFSMIASLYLIFRKKLFNKPYVILYFVLLFNLALWFFGFPAFRFGWAFIIVFIALIASLIVFDTRFINLFRYTVLIVLVLFTLQSIYKTFRENSSYLVSNSIFPVSEPDPPTTNIKLSDGVQAEVATSEECWGIEPPCVPVNYNRKLRAIGNDITEGFYIAKD